ncbi:hypothetical protein BOX15_Mlig024393g3 [Macrostomum lignano]|uniref:C2 domain-containing protein n=1 Tax=Macrostomum lignano TaxID=282301 RepID=A0A267FRE2_9PLAT|nr:hypothetical protein BOX15_Mlig024393g3 [Macrostomum lignano]
MLRQKAALHSSGQTAGSTLAAVAAAPTGVMLVLLLVILVVAAILTLLAWQRSRRGQSEPTSAAVDGGETCDWLNALVTWFFLNKAGAAVSPPASAVSVDALPRLLEQRWIAALNDAIGELASEDDGGCNKVAKVFRFEKLLVGSLPPQIRSASAGHCSDTHELQIRLTVRVEEIRLQARLGEAASGMKSCEVTLLDVEAEAALLLRLCPRGFTGSLRLLSRPRAQAEAKPLGGCSMSSQELASISQLAIAALERAVMSLTLTETVDAKVTASAVTQTGIAKQQQQKQSLQHQSDSQQQDPLSAADATVPRRHHHHHHHGRQKQQSGQQPGTQQPGSNTRLLVKVIKASSLPLPPPEHSDTAAGEVPAPSTLRQLNAYACLELDEPYQRHVTGSVFGSANPYWDQHYMFDLNANSRRLSMHVFDRSGRLDTLLGSASMRLSELPELGARIMQPLRRPSRTETPATVGPTATLTAEFLFVCPATKAEWPPIGASSDSLDDSSTRPNGDASLSRTLGDLAASERENRSSAPVRCHSNREVDRDKDTGNGGNSQDRCCTSETADAPLYITVETLIVPERWANKLNQKQLAACATEDSSAVAKPKAKPAGRSHSFASRLRRAIIGGGRRPVSTDRGGGGGGELPATSGLPSKQQPDVGGRVSGGGGLSGSLRRLLSGRGLRGHKRRLRPQDQTAKSSNPVSDRSGWNSEEIL